MSEDIMDIRELHVSSFAGGKDRGRCIQLTIGDEYEQLTQKEVNELITALTLWMHGGKKA